MRHQPYSPNLAPSDYHLLLTNDQLKYVTKEWLKDQSELLYFIGIQKL